MHPLPRTALRLLFALALLAALPASGLAQEPATPPAGRAVPHPGGRRALPGNSPYCHTGPITYIFVDNHSIFDASQPGLPQRFNWAYRAANRIHVRTRTPVIRRQMLLQVGDCYDAELVEESARLLRGFDFISRADVYGVRQADGTYHLVVDTQDEWSTDLALHMSFDQGVVFRGARLREKNTFGSGQRVELYYLEHDVDRDYGIGWDDPQLGGTRWDLSGAVGRNRAGTVARQTLQYPFLGEGGRRAARESFVRADELFDYVVPAGDATSDVLVPRRDKSADLALVGRLGRPGNLTLFGAGVSYANRSFPGSVQAMSDHDYRNRTPADTSVVQRVAGQMTPRDNVSAVLLLGQRNIWWTQKRGYDSPRGQQDIRLGGELSLTLSRSIVALARDDDLGAGLTLYTGLEAGPALLVLRGRADGRRNLRRPAGESEWQDLLAEGELLAYLRPHPAPGHTLLLRAAGAGGWRTRLPFQLTLGGDAAVRGYDPHDFPGGRRLSFTAEDRLVFGGPFSQVFDLGASVFADAGRVWAGDVPFGSDSGWRAAVGAGLRAAFPAGGRTTYRADMAVPLSGGIRQARILLSVGEVLGLTRHRTSEQIERSRMQGLSGDLFTFPR